MSDIFLNSQDSLADPFTIDPDDLALSHPSLSATHIHEKDSLNQSLLLVDISELQTMLNVMND